MPDQNNFWIKLQEITGVKREVAKAEATRIQNLYIDASKYMKDIAEEPISSEFGGEEMLQTHTQQTPFIPARDGFIEIRTQATLLRIPKDKKEITRVKKLLEIYEDEFKEEEKKK